MEKQSICVYRSYQERIKPTHPLYKTFLTLTKASKNLYNLALYHQRQTFFQEGRFLSYFELYKLLSKTEAFKNLPSRTAYHILKQVVHNLDCFKRASRGYKRNPSKYTGKPKLPKYKDKERGLNEVLFDEQQLKKDGQEIRLPSNIGRVRLPDYLSDAIIKPMHIMEHIDEYLNHKGKVIISLKIIPYHREFILLWTYEQTLSIPEIPSPKYVAAIDLGLNNFATLVFYKPKTQPIIYNGKGLKSYNNQFNKELARLQSQAMKCNGQRTTARIQRLCQRRQRYIKTWMHTVSRRIIQQLQANSIAMLIVGHNEGQKQSINLGPKTNQQFVQIPYYQFLQMLKYKCYEAGIKCIETEESYTSVTSFLDNEQPVKENADKSRRVYRGLFQSNGGHLINADVNAAYQILKKVGKGHIVFNPSYEMNLQPIKINVA